VTVSTHYGQLRGVRINGIPAAGACIYCETRFFDALRQLSGTHYRKLFSVVTLLQFLSLG